MEREMNGSMSGSIGEGRGTKQNHDTRSCTVPRPEAFDCWDVLVSSCAQSQSKCCHLRTFLREVRRICKVCVLMCFVYFCFVFCCVLCAFEQRGTAIDEVAQHGKQHTLVPFTGLVPKCICVAHEYERCMKDV